MNVGNRIKKLRLAARLTQSELALIADVPQSAIAELENGIRNKSSHVFAIAQTLNVNAFWLQTGEGNTDLDYVHPKIIKYDQTIQEIIKLMLSTDERGREKILLSAKDALDTHQAWQDSLPKADKTAAFAAQLGQEIISQLSEKNHDFSDVFDHRKNEARKHERS